MEVVFFRAQSERFFRAADLVEEVACRSEPRTFVFVAVVRALEHEEVPGLREELPQVVEPGEVEGVFCGESPLLNRNCEKLRPLCRMVSSVVLLVRMKTEW
jgi:hypothetical protein